MASNRPVTVAKRASAPQPERIPCQARMSPALGKRVVAAAAAALLLVLCAYRMLTFVPQALDSPGTLRPHLYLLFNKFVKHYPSPALAQQAWEHYCYAVLFVPAILALLNYLSQCSAIRLPPHMHAVVRSRFLLFMSIAVSLTVCRFPSLLTSEINPDETQFLAAAHKLFREPVFFRAVDCGSSGPFNIIPLMLPALFGISPDYTSARLTTIAIVLASIYFIYRTFALLADDAVVRIAVLPAAGAFAVLKFYDFLHYSSEDVSFLLLALALYICVRIFRNPQRDAWGLGGLGLLMAAGFLAKMQSVPILGCVAIVACAYVYASGHARHLWRPALLIAAGFAPLLLLNAIVCVATGAWKDFWMEYVAGNYGYVQAMIGTLSSQLQHFVDFVLSAKEISWMVVSLFAVLGAYGVQRLRRDRVSDEALFLHMGLVGGILAVAVDSLLRTAGSTILSYTGILATLMLPGSFFFLCRNKDWGSAPIRWFGFLSAAVLAAAALSVFVPQRPYHHYLLYLIFPLTIVMAWPVVVRSGEVALAKGESPGKSPGYRPSSPVPFLLVFAVLTLVGQIFEFASGNYIDFANVPSTVRPPESEIIDSLTPPGEEIAVWGWNARLYLGAGRVTATKDIDVPNFFFPDQRISAYYREGYIRTLELHPAYLFVDAIDTSWAGFANRTSFGFAVIPELNTFVQAHYVHVLDAYRERFYIRRDLARNVAGIGEPRKCDARAIRCFEAGAKSWIPADLPKVQMPEHALLEAVFTPETGQTLYATVFSNSANATAIQGFQFQHCGNDRYRLAIGCGSQFAFSRELILPQRRPASLAIEFRGGTVTIVVNGVQRDEMHLPARMVDSAGPITVGSWIGHTRPFLGNIQFFQIRDLAPQR